MYHLYKIKLFPHELALTHVDATHSVVHNDIIHTVGQHVDSCYKTVAAQTACGAQCACPPIARAESRCHTDWWPTGVRWFSLTPSDAHLPARGARGAQFLSPANLEKVLWKYIFWSNLAKTTLWSTLSAMSIVGRAIYPPPPAHTDISTHSARS